MFLFSARRGDAEPGPDAFETDRHFFRDAEGSRGVAFDLYLDVFVI